MESVQRNGIAARNKHYRMTRMGPYLRTHRCSRCSKHGPTLGAQGQDTFMQVQGCCKPYMAQTCPSVAKI